MKAAVNQIIAENLETKLRIKAPYNYNTGQTLEDFVQFSTAITSTNEVYALIPKVPMGVDDFQRIGNQIQPISLTVKVNCALGSAASGQIYADFYFCTAKGVKDVKLTNQVPTGNFLNDGDGTNVPYDGTRFTSMLPVNASQFTLLKHKRILLRKGGFDPNTLYSGGGSPTDMVQQNTSSFSVKIDLPKTLTYQLNAEETPTNAFPFMMIGFTATDYFGQTALSSLPLYVQAQSHLYYKDA